MIRKIGRVTMLCAAWIISCNVFSLTEHSFQSVSYPFTLPPNIPQVFTNTFFWTIESKCIIKSEQEDNPFSFTILRKSGAFNGIPLKTGDKMDLNVHPGDQIYITAVSGGRVELINHGKSEIKAVCMPVK